MATAAAAAKSLQSCPTLCDPIDSSLPGFAVPGILQARILEWVAISFSNALKWKVKVKSLSRVRLFTTPWTAAYQAPPSMGFSRQEYWSGLPLPSPKLPLVGVNIFTPAKDGDTITSVINKPETLCLKPTIYYCTSRLCGLTAQLVVVAWYHSSSCNQILADSAVIESLAELKGQNGFFFF